ncbi:MAG: hypothetical protein ACR2QQ_02895 [Gammaproteobacteria bacterium]
MALTFVCGFPSLVRRPRTKHPGTLLLAVSAWLLTACQAGPTVPPAAQEIEIGAPQDSIDTVSLIRYGHMIRELTADELETEYQALLMQGTPDDRPELRFRLVLLLSSPQASFYDLDRAIVLLEDYLSDRTTQTSPDVEFAALLVELFEERSSIEESSAATALQLNDERAQTAQLSQELQSTRAELDSELTQNETLRQQLDALIALEEQISLDEADQPETEIR